MEQVRRRRSPDGTGLERITATISPAARDAMERHRDRRGQTRSAFVEEALVEYVARIEADDLERLSGMAEINRRLEMLAELIGELAPVVNERTDRQADRLAQVIERDRWATETLYALVSAQFGESAEVDRRQARELAARTIRRESDG